MINFIPKFDELILYDGVMENGVYVELPRLKRGDGKTRLNDLPFLEASTEALNKEISYFYYNEILELF